MSKLVKIVFVIALLAIVGIGILLWRLDSIVERFKPQIEQTLSETIKRKVSIGKLSAKVFPRVSVVIDQVQLADGGASAADSKASVNKLYLDSELSSLLAGKIAVSEFGIEGAELTIKRLADGQMVIGGIPIPLAGKSGDASESTGAEAKEAATEPADKSTQSETTEGSDETGSEDKPLSLQVTKARLSELSVTWIDEAVSPPQTITVSDVTADISDIDIAGSAKIDLTASALGTEAGNISVSGLLGNPVDGRPIDASLKLSKLDLAKLMQLVEAYGVKLEEAKLSEVANIGLKAKTTADNKIALDLSLDGKPASVSYGEFLNKTGGTELALKLVGLADLEGNIKTKQTKLSLGSVVVDAPFTFAKGQDTTANISTSGLSLSEIGKLVPMAAAYQLGGTLDTKLSITVPTADATKKAFPKIDGPLTLKSVSASIPVGETKDPKKQPSSIAISDTSGKLSFAKGGLDISELVTKVEGQELSVKAKLNSLQSPTAAFVVNSKRLELFPIVSKVAPDLAILKKSFIEGLGLQGTYGTSSSKGDISLKIGNSSLADVPISSAEVNAKLSPTLLSLEPSVVNVFGGAVKLNGTMTQDANPRLDAKVRANKLDAEKISSVAIPSSPISLKGLIESVSVDIAANTKQFARSADGKVKLEMGPGSIEGINVFSDVLGALEKIPGLNVSITGAIPEEHNEVLQGSGTAFSSLTGDIALGAGRANIQRIALQHPLYIIDGNGWLGLEGGMKVQARLRLGAVVAESILLKRPKLKVLLDRRGNLVVPVLIQQKGNQMLVIPDTAALVKRAARNTATEAAGRALDKVAPGLGGATKVLDSLFK